MELRTRALGNVKVLEISGSFDVYSAPTARDWFTTEVARDTANIVVNLANVDFLDSTALSTLIQGKKITQANKGDLRLCNLQQPVRMIFELTRLDKVFEIFIREEEAVKAFNN